MDKLTSQLADLQIDNPIEDVLWFKNPNSKAPKQSKASLNEWVIIGSRNMSVAEEIDFISDSAILSKYISTVAEQDRFSEQKKTEAGQRLNMFESVGKMFFKTRSSLKFANMDAVIKFTNPLDPTGAPLVKAGLPMSYVDLTNSRDIGFIEYMQWRKDKNGTVGFAFKTSNNTPGFLKNKPASKLEFAPVKGDSKKNSVIRPFVNFVLTKQPLGVHLVCSDGMDYPEAYSNTGIREVLLKRPNMCNCILALSTVAENGTVFIKITNSFTRFTVGLLYLMRQHFREMCIVKPVTSRPANAEKYVVFRSKLPDTGAKQILIDHLIGLNEQWDTFNDKQDVLELVPLQILQEDQAFCDFIRNSNYETTKKQIRHIRERIDQIKNPNNPVKYSDGIKIREMCLRLWDLPKY